MKNNITRFELITKKGCKIVCYDSPIKYSIQKKNGMLKVFAMGKVIKEIIFKKHKSKKLNIYLKKNSDIIKTTKERIIK